MIPNYENGYYVTSAGEVYSITNRGIIKMKTYPAKKTGYLMLSMVINGKKTVRRAARLMADMYLENPHGYAALYVPIEDKPDLTTMFYCTTQHLNRINEAVKHGEEPKRPTAPPKKRVYKPQKPTYTANGSKPIPEPVRNLATNIVWK